MKQLYGLVIGLLIVFFGSNCGVERPVYDLDVLQGKWRRVSGNNPDADSMLIQIDGSSGVIIYAPPTSNFSNNELKWTSITSVVAPKSFILSDKSADGNRWDAEIYVDVFDGDSIQQFTLQSVDFRAAPGGEQVWIRE